MVLYYFVATYTRALVFFCVTIIGLQELPHFSPPVPLRVWREAAAEVGKGQQRVG